MVSEHSSVYKHSWCVFIELHTNAAQLKFGDKKYNSIVISFFALYYICLIKKSYFINAFDLRLHDVLFCDHSVGEAEVTTEIS